MSSRLVQSPDVHHHPSYVSGSGFAGLLSSSLTRRGVRNDRAFHRARGATCRSTGIRVLKAHGKHSHGSSNTPAFRTRMDFAACCISQGASLAPTRRPTVRAVARACTGPSARRVGVNLLSDSGSPAFARNPQRSGPTSQRPPHPAPRFDDDRDAPLIGAGRRR